MKAPSAPKAEAGSALAELAALSPSLAMDAAMALLKSADPGVKEQAVSLGALVARGQGAKVSRSRSLFDFMELMLSQEKKQALAFAKEASKAVQARSGDLLGALRAGRVLEIEELLPGFASKARPESLWRAPAVVATLRAQGKLSPRRAVSIMEQAAWAMSRGRAALETVGATSDYLLEAEASMGDARAFIGIVERLDKKWLDDVWGRYWSIHPEGASGESAMATGVAFIGLPSVGNPFKTLPEPCLLTVNQKRLLRAVAEEAGRSADLGNARRLGAYLAQGDADQIAAARSKASGHRLSFHIGGAEIFEMSPANASAEALSVFLPRLGWGGEKAEAARALRWEALCEGVALSGAPPALFHLRLSAAFKHLAGEEFKENEQDSLSWALAPLMILMAGAKPVSNGAIRGWLLPGALPGEADRLARFIARVAARRGASASDVLALARVGAELEACEIALAARGTQSPIQGQAKKARL